MKKIIQWFNCRTINQKLVIVGIITPIFTAIIVALLTKTLVTFKLNLEINNIVQKTVEQQIANIEETIKETYERRRSVYFPRALSVRTKLFYGTEGNSEELSISCFELEEIPIEKSIDFFGPPYYGKLPQNSILNFNNIVCVRSAGKIKSIFDNGAWYSIEYYADVHSNTPVLSVKDININYSKGIISVFDEKLKDYVLKCL